MDRLGLMLDLTAALKEPFPPILLAYEAGNIISEQYIESHPVKGMLLIHPPPISLQRTLPPFRYEPFFPIALMARDEELVNQRLQMQYEQYIDVINLPARSGYDGERSIEGNHLNEEAWSAVMQWIDDNF